MSGKLYIDGLDAYTYGIFVTEGGYDELVSFPALKKIDVNDWPEEDGVEPDLSEPALDLKEFAINFASHGKTLTENFIALISDKAYHTYDFREIGRMYNLRLVSQPNLSLFTNLELFSLQFANDFPFPDNYTYQVPYSTLSIPQTGYILDNRDFTDYGIRVLRGSDAEVIKSPAVKKNLLTNFNKRHGAEYDGEEVVFQTKDVKLNCLMRANTPAEFWRNYNAFLFDLTRPEERSLYVDNTGYEYPCYYKSCNTVTFCPVGKTWFEFTLTLVFISFRVGEVEYLLASEDDFFIVSEEDDELFIDME